MVGWLGNLTWIRVDEMVEDEGKRIGLIGVWLISWGFAIKRVEEVQLVLPGSASETPSDNFANDKGNERRGSRITDMPKVTRGEGRIERC